MDFDICLYHVIYVIIASIQVVLMLLKRGQRNGEKGQAVQVKKY